MQLIEKILDRPGCRIHYWTGGQQTGPLVVFTHGATVSHLEWEATLALVGEKFPIMAWDVRGHGQSRPAPFSLPDAEADLLAILDQLQVEQAVFVGHSMGGNLHQELVFHHPERVRALVFLDCTWNFQQLTKSEKFWLSLAGPIFKVYPYKLLVDQSLVMTSNSKAGQELLRASMQGLTKAEFIQIMLATSNCLHYEPGYQIHKPLLLMVGDQDPTGNIRKIMPVWAQHEPDCRFELIPNAFHAPNLDNPERFHYLLLDFLAHL